MNRFFIPPQSFESQQVIFPPETAHQMARVLRLRPGEHVLALDGSGYETEVRLEEVAPQRTAGAILSRRLVAAEPRSRLTLYLGLTQREKFEWMLQKCTEVGACGFVPVIMARSLAQDAASAGNKLARWQKILQEAAEQSGRGKVPQFCPPLKFSAALQSAVENDINLLAWEEEHTASLSVTLQGLAGRAAPRVGIFIGPEGGISVEEAALARQAGVQAVTLGARILRMETAAVAAAVLVLHTLNDL